jgi:Ca-activated chloride channel homolog
MNQLSHYVTVVCIVIASIACAVPAGGRPVTEVPTFEPAPELGGTTTLGAVRGAALLLETVAPGRFVEAPLMETRIEVEVVGLLARTTVTQTFTNPSDVCAEGIYVFPLPEGSAVDEMRLEVGGRVIEGEVREREEARREYEEARAEGRRASLLEQERPDLFTLSVASLDAGETATVTIGFDDVVRVDGGEYSLRVPLVAAPRYGGPPGAPPPGTVPAATRPHRAPFELSVDLNAGLPLDEVDSPSHRIDLFRSGPERWEVTVAEVAPALRDFHLSWRLAPSDTVRSALFTGLPGTAGTGGEHHTLLMVVPPDSGTREVVPVERVFVLDTSGSMAGPALREAQAALEASLSRLREIDRFNVIEFNSVTHRLFAGSRWATWENVQEAVAWVRSRQAGGGTELLTAMEAALEDPDPRPGELRQVVFVTDGLIVGEQQIATLLRRRLGRTRLFTVGIGSAPNGHFMELMAREGRGTFTFISTPEEVDRKMSALLRKLERPALTGLRVEVDDPTARVVPSVLPDLYDGEPLMVIARHRDPTPRLRLAGRGRTPGDDALVARSVEPVAVPGDQLSRLWARWSIREEMRRLYRGASPAEVREGVLALALGAHLVSEFTSLVAVDRTPGPGEACVSVRIPLSLPEGMAPEPAGVLPATATEGPLLSLIGLALLALALLLARPSRPRGWS